jgi:DNA-binding transcriptional MerR regulator
MSQSSTPLWTLDELTAQVALALSVDYPGQPSGRVRDVPDARTVRYYTTLGLVDRPAALRGRTALYARRHLLQLVAIKRLQAHGLSLGEIQARLVGRTDRALADVARLPEGTARAEATAPEADSDGPRRDSFWKEAPAPPSPGPASLVGVPLAGGVTLLLEAARLPDEHDLSALRAASAPLLRLLKTRRLTPGPPAEDTPRKEQPHEPGPADPAT